jgi:hypothetical protein
MCIHITKRAADSSLARLTPTEKNGSIPPRAEQAISPDNLAYSDSYLIPAPSFSNSKAQTARFGLYGDHISIGLGSKLALALPEPAKVGDLANGFRNILLINTLEIKIVD